MGDINQSFLKFDAISTRERIQISLVLELAYSVKLTLLLIFLGRTSCPKLMQGHGGRSLQPSVLKGHGVISGSQH